MTSSNARRKLTKRLATYTTAAAATAIGADAAHGEIIYTPDVDALIQNGSIDFDFNADSINDGRFAHSTEMRTYMGESSATVPSGIPYTYRVASADGLQTGTNAGFFGAQFGFEPRLFTASETVQFATDQSFKNTPLQLGQSGYFGAYGPLAGMANGEQAYLGFVIQKAGDNFFGWVLIEKNADDLSFWVREYAVQNTPNTSIHVADIPEPHSLGLLAMGAAGMAARRRHKPA